MNSTGKIIIGFVVGAAIGTVTALLMAPSTGKTARKNINKKAKKLVKQIESAMGRQQKRKVTHVGSHSKNGKAPAAALR
jgi:gas vesicle protein